MRPLLVLASLLLASLLPVAAAGPLPTELTIQGPAVAPVGGTVTFAGAYRTEFAPLVVPGARVALYVDGVLAGTHAPLVGSWSIPTSFSARGTYAVHAVANEGRPTEARSATLTVAAAVPPGPPANVVAEPVAGALAARVTWTAPADDGGAAVTQYRIERQENGGAWVHRATAGGFGRAYTDNGLVLGRTYAYRVAASNPVGASPFAAVPLAGVAPPTPTLLAEPVDLTSEVRVQVAAADGGATQQLRLERSTNGGATWLQRALVTGTSLDIADPVPMPSTPLYRATALSVVGAASTAPALVSGDAPGAPLDVTVAVPDRVVVAWSPPADGGPVQGYRILEDGVQRGFVLATASSFALTTTPGTHAYSVVATSAVADGAASAEADLTLGSAAAVTDLATTVVEHDNHAIATLTWTAPADTGGAPLRSYRITRTVDGATSPAGTAPADATSFTSGPLAGGATHTFHVEAVTAAGSGTAASVAVAVESFRWVLDHQLTAVRLCETIGGSQTCSTIAPGGTYHRAGGGVVEYGGMYEGTLTRREVPMEGRSVWVEMWESDVGPGYDENTVLEFPTTDAAGAYTVASRGEKLTPGSCTTIYLGSRAHYAGTAWTLTADTATICP